MDVDRDAYGARVRAARCYKGLELDDMAEALGMSVRTLQRIEADQRPLTIPEARKIVEATGVPLAFLLDGFRALEGGATERGSDGDRPRLPAPQGDLRRHLEDDRPTGKDRPRTWRRPAEGGGGGSS